MQFAVTWSLKSKACSRRNRIDDGSTVCGWSHNNVRLTVCAVYLVGAGRETGEGHTQKKERKKKQKRRDSVTLNKQFTCWHIDGCRNAIIVDCYRLGAQTANARRDDRVRSHD